MFFSCCQGRARMLRLAFFCVPAVWAQNAVTNVSTTNDLYHGSVRIVANIAVDGYAQALWGYSSGSYPNQTSRYVTASPQLVFSGGGCTVEPEAYVLDLSGGAISYIQLTNPGSGCTGTPAITVNPVLGGSGASIIPILSGGRVVNNGPTGFDIVSAGSGYSFGPGGGNFNSGSGQFAAAIGGLTPATTYYFVIRVCPSANNNTGCFTSSEHTFTTPPDPGHPVFPAAAVAYAPVFPNTASGYTVVPLTGNGNQECFAASTIGPISYGSSSWIVHAGDTLTTLLTEVGYGAIIELPQGVKCQVPDTAGNTCGYLLPTLPADPQSSGLNDPNHRWILIRTHAASPADFPPLGTRLEPTWAGLNKLANLQAQKPCNSSNPNADQAQIFEANSTSPSLPVHHFWIYDVEVSVNSASSNGPWSAMFQVGTANTGNAFDLANPPQYIVLDRIYFPGAAYPVQSVGFVHGTPGHVAVLNSYAASMDCFFCAQGVYFTTGGSGPVTIDNNYFDARFQGIYLEKNNGDNCNHANSCPAYTNVLITHNTLRWPSPTLFNTNWSTGWDGVARGFRNQLEFKTCRNCLVAGNVIDGQWSYQNEGSAMFFSSSGATDISGVNTTGSTDILVQSNIIRNAANVFNCLGTDPLTNTGPPDGALNSRITIFNNLAYSLGRFRYEYSGFGPGLLSGYFINEPGCQDFNVFNNTFGFTDADSGSNAVYFIPDVFTYGGGGPVQEGAFMQRNLLYLGQGVISSQTGIFSDSSWQAGYCCSNYPPVPQPVSGPPSVNVLNSAVVRLSASGTVPNATWGQNIVICSNKATGAEPWPDQSQSDCTANASSMPGGDAYPAGGTMAARQSAAGLLNAANNDYTCTPTAANPCAAGVDFPGLESALGVASHIVARAGATAAQFDYVAPDARACSIDVSPDGVNWTRVSDAGGSRQRSVVVSGLSSGATYHYRLLCYSDQTSSYFSFPGEHTSMATSGTIATAPAGTRSVSLFFRLPSSAGSARFTVTPIGGAPVSQTCSASPCVIGGVGTGSALVQVVYAAASGAARATGRYFVE